MVNENILKRACITAYEELTQEYITKLENMPDVLLTSEEEKKLLSFIKNLSPQKKTSVSKTGSAHKPYRNILAAVATILVFAGIVSFSIMLSKGKLFGRLTPIQPDFSSSGTQIPEGESITKENSVTEKNETSEETGIGGDFIWCCHSFFYHSINGDLYEFIEEKSPGAFDKFGEMFSPTEDFNVRFCFDYFGIPKEMWWEIFNKEYIMENYSDEDKLFYDADLWFSDTYYMEDAFLVEPGVCPEADSVYIRPEGDDIHTDRYFTIHPSLINYVGEDKFEEFKNKYAGTEDFNILNFIKYFNISKETFSELTETKAPGTGKIYYIYNTEYVYGTEEMQRQYFERQPLDLE